MADEPKAEEPYVDPHHRVPDDEWGQVLRDATAYREANEKESG